MKKAFTMIELIFVIVIIGILSGVVLTRGVNSGIKIPDGSANGFKEVDENLLYAAKQLVTDIRYTQHLALVDDKFDSDDSDWYKKRWQIAFVNSDAADNKPAYTIYSDWKSGSTGDANEDEIAINPMNHNQIMTGGYSGAVSLDINHEKFKGMKRLNLGLSYGIISVDMSDSCKVSGSQRIAFDYLGRPIKGKLGKASGGGNSEAYESDNLIQEVCVITLSNGTDDIEIDIERETGYTHIDYNSL